MQATVYPLYTPALVAWLRTLSDALARRRREAATRRTLAALPDWVLRDLAIDRSEIASIAAHPCDPHRAR